MKIIEEIKKLNLPTDEFVVVGSCIMAMRGIRKESEIDDIDLLVTEKVFNDFKDRGWESKASTLGENVFQGFVEAGREYWDNTTISFFDTHPECVEEFDGIRFQSLKEFYDRKKVWGRPKDIEDVALIDSFFKQRNLL